MKQDDIINQIARLSHILAWAEDSLRPESKYKFSRKWYKAEFNPADYFEVDEWCEQQFGPHPKRPDAWSRWWHRYETSILFRDEKDYVLFCLRWS